MTKPRKNRYIKNAHFSETKFRQIMKAFCADITAHDTALLTGISRNTINKIFQKLRLRIFALSNLCDDFSGEIYDDPYKLDQ
jgi:predicted DNA-binding protein (UPF0251 family)